VCFVCEQEAFKNDISAQLRFAALHDCETKWKQCGKPNNKNLKKGKIDRCVDYSSPCLHLRIMLVRSSIRAS
jgi:hypothetical protein